MWDSYPLKPLPPDYGSARATVPLWPWFQEDVRVPLLNLRFNNFLRLGNIPARNLAEAKITSLVSFAATGIADKKTPSWLWESVGSALVPRSPPRSKAFCPWRGQACFWPEAYRDTACFIQVPFWNCQEAFDNYFECLKSNQSTATNNQNSIDHSRLDRKWEMDEFMILLFVLLVVRGILFLFF